LVQQQALKAVGVNQQVEAWQQKVRKQTDEPTLSIGVMVDISGSMGHAMNPMATTAWVMSEAGRRVQARTAMVYYGSDVFPTLKAGQHLTEVRVYSANDGTEKFDLAFQALDGGLNLLNGTGARLAVIVSDGEYTSPERDAAKKWLRECQKSGVGVLWISYNGQNRGAKYIINGTDAVLVDVTDNATEASLAIGKAAVDAMNKVGVRKMA
jgi:Mg-chelatase subunit ChlD